MNIYKQEFKMKINSVITWSFAVGVLIFIYLSIFSSIAVDAKLLNEMMASFPEELLIAFGMTDIDMSTILGFFGLIFLIIDFLLAKPVGRTKIMTSKLLAAITGLTITNLVVWISSFVFLRMYSDGGQFETKPVLVLLLSIAVFQLFFLTVGMLISLLVKRVRSVTPYSMALVFGLYVLNAFGGMIGEDKLEILSPFKHFEPNYILKHAAYDLPLAWLSVAAIVISVVGSYVLYSRRNIRSAV